MNKVTKNLERALAALQLANNEIERQFIMKRQVTVSRVQGELLSEVTSQLHKLEDVFSPVQTPQPASGI